MKQNSEIWKTVFEIITSCIILYTPILLISFQTISFPCWGPTILLGSTLILSLIRQLSPQQLALNKPDWRLSFKLLTFWWITTFPIFAITFYIFFILLKGFFFQFALPQEFWLVVLNQLFYIALPEEVFFRGYLLGRFRILTSKEFKIPILSITVSAANFATSGVFAFAHFLYYRNIFELAVFLPGLLFGHLRERTNSILPPTIMHASCNLLYIILCNSLRQI